MPVWPMLNGKRTPRTSAIVKEISASLGLTQDQVGGVIDGLCDIMKRELGPQGSGTFVLCQLVKFRRIMLPAQTSHLFPHPKTGVMTPTKPKPERPTIKIKALPRLHKATVCWPGLSRAEW